MNRKASKEEAFFCISQIAPLLDGLSLDVQSAVLADLMAMYLCAIPEPAREGLLQVHIKSVRVLVPRMEKLLREHCTARDH